MTPIATGPLPIDRHRKEILDRLETWPVLFLKGETGCGKSSRVPRFLLEEYSKAAVAVGVPRVVAARNLSLRVAAELLGQLPSASAGYSTGKGKVIPPSDVGALVYATYETLWKRLRRGARGVTYVVLDEVHERTVHCDLCLKYIRDIFEANPDCGLRVVLMSATLETDTFVDYFKAPPGAMLQVPGRHHDVRRKFIEDMDLPDGVLCRPCPTDLPAGAGLAKSSRVNVDMKPWPAVDLEYVNAHLLAPILCRWMPQFNAYSLVFLPGKEAIQKAKEYLVRSGFAAWQIRELHSEKDADILQEIVSGKAGRPTVILATNIAESALTIPDVQIVIRQA